MKRTNKSTNAETSNPKERKEKYNISWQDYGDKVKGLAPLMFLDGPDITHSEKIAGFDMDFTLIETKSGKAFATGSTDWKWFSGNVCEKLNSLRSQGYKVVIFTNQAGIEKKKTNTGDIKKKVSALTQELGFPIQMFVSTGENIYRKPCVDQWTFMEEKCNGGMKANLEESFYVGDAAGRLANWKPGKKKDFSCSDRKFAANVGIRFLTPEELFFDEEATTKFGWGSIHPENVLATPSTNDYSSIIATPQELVIFVGLPAAGKSTFAKTYLKPNGYTIVNRDELKTQEKCLKVCNESLTNGCSVVIDNTNPSKESRKTYTNLAKKAGVPVRCFHFKTPRDLAEHLNMFRQSQSRGEKRRVPPVGYNMFKSKFQPPEMSEGFTMIENIEFVPDFKSGADEDLFKKWT